MFSNYTNECSFSSYHLILKNQTKNWVKGNLLCLLIMSCLTPSKKHHVHTPFLSTEKNQNILTHKKPVNALWMFLALTGLNANNEEILCQEKLPKTDERYVLTTHFKCLLCDLY